MWLWLHLNITFKPQCASQPQCWPQADSFGPQEHSWCWQRRWTLQRRAWWSSDSVNLGATPSLHILGFLCCVRFPGKCSWAKLFNDSHLFVAWQLPCCCAVLVFVSQLVPARRATSSSFGHTDHPASSMRTCKPLSSTTRSRGGPCFKAYWGNTPPLGTRPPPSAFPVFNWGSRRAATEFTLLRSTSPYPGPPYNHCVRSPLFPAGPGFHVSALCSVSLPQVFFQGQDGRDPQPCSGGSQCHPCGVQGVPGGPRGDSHASPTLNDAPGRVSSPERRRLQLSCHS